MREGRRRPSLDPCPHGSNEERARRNEGGAPAPLVAAPSNKANNAAACRNEGGAPAPLVGPTYKAKAG